MSTTQRDDGASTAQRVREKARGPHAFPSITQFADGSRFCSTGMTLRDFFMAQALRSVLYKVPLFQGDGDQDAKIKEACRVAAKCADALLAERAKNNGSEK